MIKDTGFTLIELAIVIVIIGLMMSAFFSAATIYIKQKRIDDMQARFSEVRLAMARYIFDNPNDAGDEVRYPCPASLTAVPGDVDFGRELCPLDYAAIAAGDDLGGVFAVEGSTPGSLVLVGAIPTTALDIRDNLMLDEFGNRFTYAVTMDLTQPDALLARPVAQGQITIVDQNGNVKTASGDFVIVSHGQSGAGSYTQAGVPNGEECRSTAVPGAGDSQNCLWLTEHTAVFKEQSGFGLSSSNNDDDYDDMVAYTLAEDDGWWQATGGAGSDIVNKNPANIGIGPGISLPVQRLDIDGAIKVANTTNVCSPQAAGSIRYNNGAEAVVECCNGSIWQNITFGCGAGECNPATKGQIRPNMTTGTPEFCNGTDWIPVFGADCSSHFHGEVFMQSETDTQSCNSPMTGNMTRSRQNEMMCSNGAVLMQQQGTWSGFDTSECVAPTPPPPVSVTTGAGTCTPYTSGPCAGSCGQPDGDPCPYTWHLWGTARPGGCAPGHAMQNYTGTSYTCVGTQ